MNKVILASFLVFASFIVHAQDQKWSIEANYPFTLNDGAFTNNDGAIDLGVKYRFFRTDLVRLGIDLNGGFVYDKAGKNNEDSFKAKTYLFQPKVFAEFDVPFAPKFHPMIGLGYSVVSNNFSGTISGTDFSDRSGADGGFNFDIGIAYDFSKRLFLQLKYDMIVLQVKDEVVFDNERISIDFRENINRLKIGLGFRF